MFNILIVDDEIKITQVIKAYLDKEGYNTIVANNGEQALECFSKNSIDLMILDRMLPDISGEEICEKVRKISKVHIIMLTAKTEDSDKIDGFNTGCENKDLLKFSDELEIDMNSHEVKVRGKKVELTNTEYKILLLFAKNQNKVFTREQLLELTIEEHYEKIDRVIDAHVKNLRQKIELDTKKATIIKTVYGVGYKFGL